MKNYIDLSNSISWNNYSSVESILSKDRTLDILYKNGKYFNMAVEINNIDILKSLLNYFENNMLSKFDVKSEEYGDLQKNIVEILEVAIDEVDISHEMKQVLSPYIDFGGSEDSREHDFEGFDFNNLPISFEYEQDQNKEVKISGDNIIEHNQHTEIVS